MDIHPVIKKTFEDLQMELTLLQSDFKQLRHDFNALCSQVLSHWTPETPVVDNKVDSVITGEEKQ